MRAAVPNPVWTPYIIINFSVCDDVPMDFDGLIAVQTGLGTAALFVINPIL
jgi:NADH:ubiquinone oxidoreductase subunit F (NADH-binding)